MKHKGRLAVAIIVLLTLATPVQAATPKAGAKCTKAGATANASGKKFTCIKSGTKLVWNKGVAIKKPTPTQSPTPTPTPTPSPTPTPTPSPTPTKVEVPFEAWSINTSAKAISDAAQASFRDWAAVQRSNVSNHKLVIQPNAPESRKKNFQRTDELGVRLFAQYFIGGSVTVIGSSENWVVENLNSNGGRYKNCSDNAGNQGLNYCLDLWKTQGYVVTTDMGFDAINPGNDGSGLLAHEYFHMVQSQMANLESQRMIRDGYQDSDHLFPAWLIEGSANFVGFSVSALALGGTYWEGRKVMLTYAPQGDAINSHSLQDYEIRNGPGNNSPTYPYIAGQVATEYLVASVGFEKTLNIWLSFRETKDFKKSFEKAIGISIEEFYKRFEAVRTVLGLPVVSHKLVCLTSFKLTEVPTTALPCILTENPNPRGDQPPGMVPPPIDRSSNVDGLGCRYNEPDLVNAFGTFVCTPLPDQNNRWRKKP